MKVHGLLAALAAFSAVSADTSNIRGGSSSQADQDEARELLGVDARTWIRDQDSFRARQSFTCGTCSDEMVGTRATDARDDIFNQLSVREYESVVNFVIDQGLADSTIDGVNNWEAALNTNYFVFAQLDDPPKQEALAYLDGLTETPPDRFAIVTVHRGRASPRDVMVCMVLYDACIEIGMIF